MAGAALAVSLATSQAAPVYSQNVVGYATPSAPPAYEYSLWECPFVMGASNGANEVFGTDGVTSGKGLPDGSSVITWNPNTQQPVIAVYDTSVDNNASGWYLYDDYTAGPIPILAPGTGFYLLPNGSMTAPTFVGSVTPNIGGTKTINISAYAYEYVLAGSTIPFSGAVDNTSGINLSSLPDGSSVITWNPNTQQPVIAVYDTTVGNNPDNWYLYDDFTPGPDPSIGVAQGFYILPNGVYSWTQTLTP